MNAAPWEDDITEILDRATAKAKAPIRKAINLRELLIEAWEFGYTTGMADSAKFASLLESGTDQNKET